MKRALLAFALAFILAQPSQADDPLPYLGNWSNGRGETLRITSEKLSFADDRAVKYRDITRATDGSAFELQITTPGEVNAFPGKILGVVCEKDSMRITTYASHGDYMQEQDAQSVVLWFKDDSGDE